MSALFDEPNLIGSAGLVPAIALTGRIGLAELADRLLTVPGAKDCAGVKVTSVLAGMLAGADSIDGLDLLRHGAMGKLFGRVRAPSTLGSFLRSFKFGHVRQLDAVASRAVALLAGRVPGLLPTGPIVWLDVDDAIKPVYGRTKQGAEHGYTRIRGLNAQIATVSGPQVAPVITAARLRRGAASSAHGAVRLVRDALATAIATIDDTAWVPVVYPNAIVDPDTGELISSAEVAEITYTAFTSHGTKGQVTGR